MKVGSPHCGSMRVLESVSRRRGSVIAEELDIGVILFEGLIVPPIILSLDHNNTRIRMTQK